MFTKVEELKIKRHRKQVCQSILDMDKFEALHTDVQFQMIKLLLLDACVYLLEDRIVPPGAKFEDYLYLAQSAAIDIRLHDSSDYTKEDLEDLLCNDSLGG